MRSLLPSMLLCMALGACTRRHDTAPPGVVRVDGSSTVFLLSETLSAEFHALRPNLQVSVGISGTTGGLRKLCAREIDVADASRPINAEELHACASSEVALLELPVALDGIAVTVNPHNTWVDHLTIAELKHAWEPSAQGRVTRWSDLRPGWPQRELHLYGAGSASGTFDYFTEAIVGRARASRTDYTSSEDDNIIVQSVAADELGLGYFGLPYFLDNESRLKLVPIAAKEGARAVSPTNETVHSGAYQPLSRPLFIYVSGHSLKRAEVEAFVSHYLQAAARAASQVGFIPLPASASARVVERFRARTYGSAFKDHKSTVGIPLEALVAAPRP